MHQRKNSSSADTRREWTGSALQVGALLTLLLGLCIIVAYVLIDSRRVTLKNADEVASRLLVALVADAARTFETLDLSLQGVIENLSRSDIDVIEPNLRQTILFDRSASARHLGSLLVVDRDGYIRYDSRTVFPKHISVADRDYFKVQRDSPDVGLFIGKPLVSRLTGSEIVAVSRRLSAPDGSFDGVVVGSFRLKSFQALFQHAALGPESNITMSHTDGTLLMRWPMKPEYIGMNIKKAKLYDYLAKAPTGSFETAAVTDGVRRLIVYSKVKHLPLVIGVGQSVDAVFAQWKRSALMIGSVVAGLCVIGGVLGFRLIAEFKRRSEVERQLAHLAATDSLTGLSNRRTYEEALTREWRRAKRHKKSVAVLMIDLDLFKTFNDEYGHQAGDRLLQALGSAIRSPLQRPGDVGARYGGDEFSALLPETNADGAMVVGRKICRVFEKLCREAGIRNPGLSVGISDATPATGGTVEALIKRADFALYRAKNLGRNRIEIEMTGTDTDASTDASRHAA